MKKLPGISKGQADNLIFIGRVVDVMDPLELGRLKVQIINENEDVETEDLPWCTVLMPMTSASLGGIGTSPTWIEKGSYVMGMYLDGKNKRQPLLIGTFNMIPENDINKHDVNALARGENTANNEPVGPEPTSSFAAEYPFNKVIATKAGHIIEIDDTEGQERLHVFHKTGSYFHIDKDGTIIKKSVKDDYEITVGNSTVYVEGNANVHILGNSSIKVDGDMDTEVGGKYTLKVSGEVKINGSKILLNK
jgi:hypothetical protein